MIHIKLFEQMDEEDFNEDGNIDIENEDSPEISGSIQEVVEKYKNIVGDDTPQEFVDEYPTLKDYEMGIVNDYLENPDEEEYEEWIEYSEENEDNDDWDYDKEMINFFIDRASNNDGEGNFIEYKFGQNLLQHFPDFIGELSDTEWGSGEDKAVYVKMD